MQEETATLDPVEQYDIYLSHPRLKPLLFFLGVGRQSVAITLGAKVMRDLPFCDMLGVKSQQLEKDLFKVTLNSYPKRKGCLGKEKRRIESVNFWMCVDESQFKTFKMGLIEAITNRKIKEEQELRLLAYWNPKAGSNSKAHLTRVKDLIRYTNFSLDLVQTTHRGHCREHLNSIDSIQYRGILFISGDGLLHEFVNSDMAFRLPVSHVPAGSGNGISRTLAHNAGEECTSQNSVFLAVKGRVKEFNVVRIELEKQQRAVLSVLSFEWAFLADLDISSEFLRWLGIFRLDLWGLYRVINFIRYRGRLSYSDTQEELPSLNQPLSDKYTTVEGDFFHTIFSFVSHLSTDHWMAPFLKVEDRRIDVQFADQSHGWWAFTKLMASLGSSASHFDLKKGIKSASHNFTHSKVKSFRLQPLGPRWGHFCIDGENSTPQKMQARLHDSRYTMFV